MEVDLKEVEEVLDDEEVIFVPDYRHIRAFLKGLRPVRRITVSEWAEAYRVLGHGVSNISGPWRNEVTPYLVPIMDALSVFSSYKEVWFMKGTQIGATSVAENFIGYCMHITPAPILNMFPTVAVAKRNSKRRIAPLIDDSPALRAIVSPAKSRDGSNTVLEKEFPGGNILLCGANSPSDLRSVNIRFCVFDEIDEYPMDLADQGDPIEIAKKRTSSYDSNKKMLFISTPTTKGNSHIERGFLKTDQNSLHVPCPHCNFYQELVFEQFRFEKGNPAGVYYECIECKKEIHNHHKNYMLPRSIPVPKCPEKASPDVIGFHVPAFYSPVGFYSWATMAKDYEEALEDPIKMKTFVQTTMGLPYEEDGDQPPYKMLYQRAVTSDYGVNQIPDEVCFLTAGMDVQKDRIEIEIVGWGKARRSWSIDFIQLLGDPDKPEVWQQLLLLLSRTWIRETDGLVFGISMSCIDSGYATNAVYEFSLRMGQTRIMPVKGVDTQVTPISSPKAVYIKRDGKKSQSLYLINVNVDYYKTAIYSHLGLMQEEQYGRLGPPLFCHFPNNYQEEHFKRLTAERKIFTANKKPEWKKVYVRNEQLDCRVYASAAATLFGIERFSDADFDRMSGSVKKQERKQVEKKPQSRLPNLGGLPGL